MGATNMTKNTAGRRIGYQLDNSPKALATDETLTDKADDPRRSYRWLALACLREGDTLVVGSMNQLATNLQDLCKVVGEATARGAAVQFVEEGLTLKPAGDDGASGLTLQTFMALANFVRTAYVARRRDGAERAKREGKYAGRGLRLTTEQILTLRERVNSGHRRSEIAREFGISRSGVDDYVRNYAQKYEAAKRRGQRQTDSRATTCPCSTRHPDISAPCSINVISCTTASDAGSSTAVLSRFRSPAPR